ncbi:MAG: META domain-containing protein [Vibrio sp.]
MKLSSISTITAIASAVIIAGCASQKAAPITAKDLQAHRWVLTSVDKQAIKTDPTSTQPFLQFDDTMMASGNASCNNFFGKAKLEKNRLLLDKLALTMKLCSDAVMKQEQVIHRSLSSWTDLSLAKETLTVKTPKHTLVYKADSDAPAEK